MKDNYGDIDFHATVQQWRRREAMALEALRLDKGDRFVITCGQVTAHAKTEGEGCYMDMTTVKYGTIFQVVKSAEFNEGGTLDVIVRDVATSAEYLIDVMDLDNRALKVE